MHILKPIAAIALLVAPALAQSPAERGQALAEQQCARCHIVSPGGGTGWTDAPSFAALAADPSKDRAWFRRFFSQPHWHMLGLFERSPAEVDAIAAYVASLRR